MNKENTLKLVKRFPVLYQDFYSDMTQTCMCWGFDHGDGWFDIIWQLSLGIEEELNYSWFQKKKFLFKKSLSRRWNKLVYKISPVVRDKTKVVKGDDNVWRHEIIEKAKPRLQWIKRFSWWPYTGFAVQQVKEKFGTLRFYCGYNETINRLITLDERLSACTCEKCGKYGETGGAHWLQTLCKECENETN